MAAHSLKAFIGSSGTGKTHNLVLEAATIARSYKWESFQTLLGLTFMHGARRRLDSNLAHLKAEGIPVHCRTIDSFCLDILRRFRNYLGYDRQLEIDMTVEDCDYCECSGYNWVLSIEKMRSETIKLLEKQVVKNTLAASYPVIVVDEFQDCDGSLLKIIQALAEKCLFLLAADPFQRLEIEDNASDGTECDAVEWVNKSGEIVILEKPERTRKRALLNTAKALRLRTATKGCIQVKAFEAPGLAAYEMSKSIGKWGWGKDSDVVLITPATEATSTFVASVMKSLRKELGKTEKFGPFPFYWEQTEDKQFQEICELMPHADPISGLVCKETLLRHRASENKLVSEICMAGFRISSLRGQEGLPKTEITHIARRLIHSKMAYCSPGRKKKRLALTVHAAKNREFGYVFILWPRKLKSDNLLQRKLLYNAVTRASEKAMVLVEGTEDRINSDAILSLIKRQV